MIPQIKVVAIYLKLNSQKWEKGLMWLTESVVSYSNIEDDRRIVQMLMDQLAADMEKWKSWRDAWKLSPDLHKHDVEREREMWRRGTWGDFV